MKRFILRPSQLSIVLAFMIGCAVAATIAFSVFAFQVPPWACVDGHCKEGREWLTRIVTLAVILGGVFQYWKAQRWKRAEWMAAQTQSFFGEPKVMNALQMLDWNTRRLPLLLIAPPSQRSYFDFKSSLLVTALYSTSTIPSDPLSGKERGFTEDELAVRDAFDHMLSRLERFEIFVEKGLVSFSDLDPYIAYWIELIGDPYLGRKSSGAIVMLWHYINDYGFDKVQRLCARFGYDIIPRKQGAGT